MASILVEKTHPAITTISFNRPEKRNALSIGLLESFGQALNDIFRDSQLRALIIKGEGKVFSAGLDLEEAQDLSKGRPSAHLLAEILKKIYTAPVITVATVQGAAFAGGAGIMSACDFALATPEAQFCYPEVRRGLVAGLVMTFLKRQLKERDLKELLLLGDLISSERALQMGLINQIVKTENLQERAINICLTAAKGGPQAIKRTKQLIDNLHAPSVHEAIESALFHHKEARESEEAQEGMKSFFSKRNPRW